MINKIDITITIEELSLLNKGLKYNLGQKLKHWIRNLACEAGCAIALLPSGEQEHVSSGGAVHQKTTSQKSSSSSSS